ncbi:hypothetical protein CWI75_02260 [Kineobactrum sediminis]|uniref:Uncharacterized protein n=1 Tax=Kineobactrum sediminis TaxID=1905677 RepID=A0A2N5Y718_9GAMM|nr:HD-GYP domain-containing protein [Kineobactrum sediminis]PLW84190.1 hypothetical protein CWI75_02260 [Kineobactrum sediminis]
MLADHNKRQVMTLVLIYVVAATLWILLSDWLLFSIWPGSEHVLGSNIKGTGFVIFTSLVLWILLHRISHTELRAEQAETATTLNLFNLPQFFASLPVVVYVLDVSDGDSRAIWVSRNIEDIIGYPVSVALEPGWWEKNLHPEHREQNVADFREILEQEGGNHAYHFRHGDGPYVFIKDELRLISRPDSNTRRYIGVWTDISESHKAEEAILDYSKKLEHAMFATVNSIARLSELRDPYTSGHERRVGEMGAAIAVEMGLDQHTCMGLRIAGLLHDIGKIAVPAEILVKPGRLSGTEYALVKEHPEYGYSILKDVTFPWPVARVAREHHERMNGSGYPQGLKGEQISLEARIIAVADVIESMASHRPYRAGLGLAEALEEIERGSGTLYDAKVVAACLTIFREQDYVITD